MTYSIDMLIQKVLDCDKQYDLSKIILAYEVAFDAHKDQLRASGEPYISHPLAVAFILLELGMDTDTICAAILHDVVEDTDIPLDTIKKKFGEDIANLVDGVTKLGKIPIITEEEQQAENVRKILLAMSEDIRVIIIKLADRLHNMRTLHHRPEHKRRITALETMDIYAPIAHRLGIRAVKEELEDIAFHYLDPYACAEIENMLEIRKYDREAFIDTIRERIGERLVDIKPPPKIDGRVKSLYGIYKKVYVDGRSFEEIYDIYAVRIIVTTVIECYNVLGTIHDMFRPIPNRFKDYISTPKPNMYQSLHTTVIGREGIPFEVQIRTTDMHNTAEYGIAAHWKYKAGITSKDKLEERLAWLRRLIEAQQESDDATDLVHSIKSDLVPEEVFAITPKGDMISLPIGSTIIDFAYAIHTQVGHRMNGAKVDGRIVPLDYELKTGEIVEILTSKSEGHGPNRAWLDIAKTSEARSKIRTWFKRERRDENILQGKIDLERELKRNFIYLDDETRDDYLLKLAKRQNCETLDDLYASIGYGGITLSKIMPRLKEEYVRMTKNDDNVLTPIEQIAMTNRKALSGVIVEGIDNCLIKFARCCNPLPGDEIIGFITRGHGVSVHKADCANVIAGKKNEQEAGRWINVSWAHSPHRTYRATLDIVSYDRYGLIADVTATLANTKVPIHEINARGLKNGNANIVVTLGIAGVDQLKNIILKLEKTPGVISVERTGQN